MCTACSKKQPEEKSQPVPQRRKKIWELDEGYLCPIIGTCLSVDELIKLGRKTEMELAANLSAYEIHVRFVQESSDISPDSRLINKRLDRKYQLAIKQASRLKSSAELEDFWKYSKGKNRLAAAFWAILTHPRASTSLCYKLHGEVHMLSHLAGATRRSSDKRLREQRDKIQVLQEALSQARADARQEISWRDDELAEMEGLRQQLAAANNKAAVAEETIAELSQGQKLDELQHKNRLLKTELSHLTTMCDQVSDECSKQMGLALQASKEQEQLQMELQATSQERDALEKLVRELAGEQEKSCQQCQCQDCPSLNLCGRCVLYVGGQNSLIPHYRQVVEKCGGRFIHHDGGKEEQRIRLGAMMSKADAVICPVNCVSHDACLRAKKLCKSQAKPFIATRSAGLSALLMGLQEMASQQDIH